MRYEHERARALRERGAIEFAACRIATASGSEEGFICRRGDVIVGIVVSLQQDEAADPAFYLLKDFAADVEGEIFRSLEDVRSWFAREPSRGSE